MKLRSLLYLTNYVSQLFTGGHHLKNTKSQDQFSGFLEKYADGNNNCMIIGDFNSYWNKPDNTKTNRLRFLLANNIAKEGLLYAMWINDKFSFSLCFYKNLLQTLAR